VLFRSLRCKNFILPVCIHAEVVLTDRCKSTVFDITSFCRMQLTVCLFTIYYELWKKLISETSFSFQKTEIPEN